MAEYNIWEDYCNFSSRLFPECFNSQVIRNDKDAAVGETSLRKIATPSSCGFPPTWATSEISDSFNANTLTQFNKRVTKASTTSASIIPGSTSTMKPLISYSNRIIGKNVWENLSSSSTMNLTPSPFQKNTATSRSEQSQTLLDEATTPPLEEFATLPSLDPSRIGLHQMTSSLDEFNNDMPLTITSEILNPHLMSTLNTDQVDNKLTGRRKTWTDDLKIDFDPEKMNLVPVTSSSYDSGVITSVPAYSPQAYTDIDLEEMLATTSSFDHATTKPVDFDDKFASLVDWMKRICHDELRTVAETRKPSHFCVFCKKNGETWEFFSTHSLKDNRGKVICPVLRNYVCPNCQATGDNAHTLRHCSVSKGGNMAETFKTPRTSSGIRKLDI